MSPSSMTLFSGIFVSYRRDDSSGHAGRLFDHLVNHFGKDRIFMDIDIEPGEDFVTAIENALGSCEILIAIIGRHWLFEAGETTRRLDNPNDFVRLEIATALKGDLHVIPVLVQRASMPKPQDLPDELARFTRRNAIELSDVRWRHDVDQLIRVLEKILNDREESRRRAAQEEEERQLREAKLMLEESLRLAEAARLAEAERQRKEAEELRAEEEERRRRAAAEVEKREAEEALRQRADEERVRAEAEKRRLAGEETEHRRVDGSKKTRTAIFFILVCLGLLLVIALLWPRPETTGYLLSTAPAATPTVGTSLPTPSPPPPATIPDAPPGMVFVPGGEFTLGRDDGDKYERPAHRVTVKPFFIDIYEVTNEDYRKFIKATSHAAPSGWQNEWTDRGVPSAEKRKPVTGIRWQDAVDYAGWANKRLPTEEEWEFAARGSDGRRYPWGNKWGPGLANASGAAKGLVAVGTFQGKSPFGLYDMAGNAWEWTASDMREYTNDQASPKSSRLWKIIRGGTWESEVEYVTTTYRRAYRIRDAKDYTNLGFRCAKDLPNISTAK